MPTTTTVFLEVPCLEGIADASDAELIAVMRAWGAARRTVDAGLAQLAGVVAARSSLELGYDGLAQRAGARSPEAFVSQLTGTSGTEARAITTVGTMMNDPAPWLSEVVTCVSDGTLSVGAAAAIQTGLGAPSSSVAADDLADAAHELLETAGSLPPEKVARAARAVRDELDEVGVADREELLRSKRALYLYPQANGMTRISGLLDPESAALVTDAIDAVTSPKRGGPRFVDSEAAALAKAIEVDPREPQQLALDALVEMVRIAVATDSGRVFGLRKPSVRVHVTASDFAHGTGVGHLEGQTAAVSMKTVERLACTDGFTAVEFDDHGQALRLGTKPRTFTDNRRLSSPPSGAGAQSAVVTSHPPGPKHTTSATTNETTDPPTSTTASCSADSTTSSSTTTDGTSSEPAIPAVVAPAPDRAQASSASSNHHPKTDSRRQATD
jgi:hypothetical protein